ncbi:hypothetical protein ACIBG7_43035 [Nonomuraea sp. NPDC050328]|uniref:hypothetical protein n=1 Tax=Nonomuraea sp. NPDC050328 TaxID=3364361 RepID=UPI0037907CF9
MTTQGRYGGGTEPGPPPPSVIRLTGTPEEVAALLRVVEVAVEAMPGWHLGKVSALRPQRDTPGRVSRYINVRLGPSAAAAAQPPREEPRS